MNDLYSQMLSAYDISTEQQKRNAIFEVNQQVILAGLLAPDENFDALLYLA